MSKQINPSKRKEVFDFIVKFKQENDGNSPTLREIANGCDMSSVSVSNYYLEQLVKDGSIELKARANDRIKSRMICIVGGQWNPPFFNRRRSNLDRIQTVDYRLVIKSA